MAKEIVILCGIPCSGKSSWARTTSEIYSHMILSRDDIRDSISIRNYVYTKENEDSITKTFNFWFDEYIKNGCDIILDNTHCKEKYIQEWINKKPKDYSLRIVFFPVSLWKAYYRNVVRYISTGKWIPFKVINDMKKNYDKIAVSYTHLTLPTNREV